MEREGEELQTPGLCTFVGAEPKENNKRLSSCREDLLPASAEATSLKEGGKE
jgi:hypothetical protein